MIVWHFFTPDNQIKCFSFSLSLSLSLSPISGIGIEFVGLLKSALKEKNISDNIAIFHCIIHQQNLSAKSLKFKYVMGPVIKAVNFIRARKLNHRQFQKFLDDLDTEHQNLAYFSEVRWLSKDSMLRRFYEL